WRHVVRTAPHLAHEPLLLHLATEVPKNLPELPWILDYDSHSRTRIPVKASASLLLQNIGANCPSHGDDDENHRPDPDHDQGVRPVDLIQRRCEGAEGAVVGLDETQHDV